MALPVLQEIHSSLLRTENLLKSWPDKGGSLKALVTVALFLHDIAIVYDMASPFCDMSSTANLV